MGQMGAVAEPTGISVTLRHTWRHFSFLIAAMAALAALQLAGPTIAGAAPGDYVETFGPDGTAASEFARPAALGVDEGSGAVYVADQETQVLYKFDANGNPLNYGGSAGYISGNEITGLALPAGDPGSAEIAVDSHTHVVYVTSGNKIRAFEEDGEPHEFTSAGTSELSGATELTGLAVDDSGDIYASDPSDQKIRIYSPSGALITEFAPHIEDRLYPFSPAGLAVAPDGTLYAVNPYEPPHAIFQLQPSSFPISAQTSYGGGQQVSNYLTFSAAVDPETQFVYTGEYCFQDCALFPVASHIGVYEENRSLIGFLGDEEAGAMGGSVPGLGTNGNSGKVYALVRGEGGGRSQVKVFETLRFFEGPPTITGVAVTKLTSASATLQAKINPNTAGTTYYFEYGTSDCSVEPNSCTKVPLGEAAIGSGHDPVPVDADISGLSPDTVYFYRVVAKNSFETTESPIRTLRTQVSAFGFLPMDERVWEQVTPRNKFGGGISNTGGVIQAATDGSGIAFPTHGSIVADPGGNRAGELPEVLAARGADAWGITDLVPPHTQATGLAFFPEYKAFTPDLGQAVLEPHDGTPLSPEASERTPYLRANSQPPSYRPLVTTKEGFANVPPGTVLGEGADGDRDRVSVAGGNPRLSHIVISSISPLAEGAGERALYIWHDGAVEPVSQLPSEEGGNVVRGKLGSGTISVRNAVSEDGSRVFWASGESTTVGDPALYLRDTQAEMSVRLDVPQPGVPGTGNAAPTFMAASRDGSIVFFTDSQQLTADASQGGRDLYRCVLGDVDPSLGCVELEDLSASLNGPGEDVVVQEIAPGMAEDGSSIYFVENAKESEPELYLWQAGMGVTPVASLSPEDHPDWGETATEPAGHSSRTVATSSPDGRYLVFMSEENLTDSETNDPANGEPVEQAYRYDADTDELACISCNPSGSTDYGRLIKDNELGLVPDLMNVWPDRLVGATLPESAASSNTVGFSFYHPRAVLDNGRAYFNSPSALVPADSNGTWDVYQYEPFGVGTCSPDAGSGSIAVVEDACVGLISSGNDDKPSIFFDASASGDDVFFGTSDRLSALDSDTVADVYDARVGGVAAVAPQHPECLGEACQPPPSPPNDPTPASAAFAGPGNSKAKPAKHCRRGQHKVKKKGKVRCVKRRHHSKRGAAR